MPPLDKRIAHWQAIYNQVALCDVLRHFKSMDDAPYIIDYLAQVLSLCPRGGRTLEVGIGTGYGPIWLSKRGVYAEGLDNAPAIVERAIAVNGLLGGNASYRLGDMFALYDDVVNQLGDPVQRVDRIELVGKAVPRSVQPVYEVIHHQGVLEHLTLVQMRAAVAQQVALASYVVFSVPSVYYTNPEFGDERLLPIELWAKVLEPFDVVSLEYYGHAQSGNRDHILCVLRGQPVTDALRAMMSAHEKPFPKGITAIVHARNEEKNLPSCLDRLRFAKEIIVLDMDSTDDTVEVAQRYNVTILHHPLLANFDQARNVSALFASFSHILFVDADEWVTQTLASAVCKLVDEGKDDFAGMLIAFQHHFSGHRMDCLSPGFTSPRLLQNGKFFFNARLHSGAQVDGPVTKLPCSDPEMAFVHWSFDDIPHYLAKMGRYTDGEAQSMQRDGQPFDWRATVRHGVQDMRAYYDDMGAHRDGWHGFAYTWLSTFYRIVQHLKNAELRERSGQMQPAERVVPQSVEEMLEYALQVAREKPAPQRPALRVNGSDPAAADVAWSAPMLDPSGYGEEARHFVRALQTTEKAVAAYETPWSGDDALLTQDELAPIQTALARPVRPGFIQIVQNFPTAFAPHPQAVASIGRTMTETVHMQPAWVTGCNRMDYIWVPSEFNRASFGDAGVVRSKLRVIPGCLDAAPYLAEPAAAETCADRKYRFLASFDVTLHKGWDVLLRAFIEAFEGEPNVSLTLKVWSTMGYSGEGIETQMADYTLRELGHDLRGDARVRFFRERLPRAGLRALYREHDCYVLPSRGEGWGRPYMEAMACGLPSIATNWSGNLAFMHAENSYLIDAEVVDVPETGWREIPTYKGHRWAEPNVARLVTTLRRVFTERSEAHAVGLRAREEILDRFNLQRVGKLMADELDRVRQSHGASGGG